MTAAPSSSSVLSRPGRWTLTMTGVPSARAARYTCEIEALAIGVQSNAEKTSAGSWPSWAATCGRISASGAGSALERSKRELVAPRSRQDVAARRGDLAELDEDAAGLLEGAPHAAGERFGGHAARDDAVLAGQRHDLAVAPQRQHLAAQPADRVADLDQPGRLAPVQRAHRATRSRMSAIAIVNRVPKASVSDAICSVGHSQSVTAPAAMTRGGEPDEPGERRATASPAGRRAGARR